jgi:hypothetical protein
MTDLEDFETKIKEIEADARDAEDPADRAAFEMRIESLKKERDAKAQNITASTDKQVAALDAKITKQENLAEDLDEAAKKAIKEARDRAAEAKEKAAKAEETYNAHRAEKDKKIKAAEAELKDKTRLKETLEKSVKDEDKASDMYAKNAADPAFKKISVRLPGMKRDTPVESLYKDTKGDEAVHFKEQSAVLDEVSRDTVKIREFLKQAYAEKAKPKHSLFGKEKKERLLKQQADKLRSDAEREKARAEMLEQNAKRAARDARDARARKEALLRDPDYRKAEEKRQKKERQQHIKQGLIKDVRERKAREKQAKQERKTREKREKREKGHHK